MRHILRGKSAGYDAIADDAATLLLARTAPALAAGAAAAVDVGDLADRVERLLEPGQDKRDSTSLQRECSARARSEKKASMLRDRSER